MRLAAQAKGGFYPTPPERRGPDRRTGPRPIQLLRLPRDRPHTGPVLRGRGGGLPARRTASADPEPSPPRPSE